MLRKRLNCLRPPLLSKKGSKMVFTICLMGTALGLGAAFLHFWVLKRLTKKNGPEKTPPTKKPGEDTAAQAQLDQLRRQLDSGLLTKEEYREKKQTLLKKP